MTENKSSWEIREEEEIKARRREIDEKIFIGDNSKTFESFDPNYNGQTSDMNIIIGFLTRESDKRLILKGDVGRGKTHLSQACKNYFVEHGERAEIISARRLYRLFRELEGFDCEYIYEKAMKRIWSAKLFIIDDMGNEKQNDTQVFNQNLIEILDEFKGKIIITTNLSEPDMEKIYGAKIVSRLYDNATVIVLKGKDYRRG
jgi:DNA replication protein DnaC